MAAVSPITDTMSPVLNSEASLNARGDQLPALGLLDTGASRSERQSNSGSDAESTSMQSPVTPQSHNDPIDQVARSHVSLTSSEANKPVVQRVAIVREQQGMSQRTVARRLGIEQKVYRQWEEPGYDLSLSQLLALQSVFEVPLTDLIEDRSALSNPIAERAKLIKIMKTVVALRGTKCNAQVERMVNMLFEQLVDLMPELAEVSGWPQFGTRRGQTSICKALSQPIDTSHLSLPD